MTYTIKSNGNIITNLREWFKFAPPVRGYAHWKDGRSAKESARRWICGYPPEIKEALDSDSCLKGFIPQCVKPEYKTCLDTCRGPRNHDVIVTGCTNTKKVLLGIEAKADENFGDLVSKRLRSAKSSGYIPRRINNLSKALFGKKAEGNHEIGGLRYQLIHGCAATIIEAGHHQASAAVFLVHVFVTDKTRDKRLKNNAQALNKFVKILTKGKVLVIKPNTVIGPFTIPGYQCVPATNSLFIGKAVAYL